MGYTTFSFFFSLFLFCSTATRVSPTTAPRAPERGSHLPSAPSIGDCVHVSLRVLQLAPLLPSRRLLVGSVPILAGNRLRQQHRPTKEGRPVPPSTNSFWSPILTGVLRAGFDQPNPKQGSYSDSERAQSAGFRNRIPLFRLLSRGACGSVHKARKLLGVFRWQVECGVSPRHLRSNLFDGTVIYCRESPVPLHTGTRQQRPTNNQRRECETTEKGWVMSVLIAEKKLERTT